jgi:hypothetical protein
MGECLYCGRVATSYDHAIPLSFLESMNGVREIKGIRYFIPACLECNCLSSGKIFKSFSEKRKYLRITIARRYKKYLNIPDWDENEILEMGRTLQDKIRRGIALKMETQERIKYISPIRLPKWARIV